MFHFCYESETWNHLESVINMSRKAATKEQAARAEAEGQVTQENGEGMLALDTLNLLPVRVSTECLRSTNFDHVSVSVICKSGPASSLCLAYFISSYPLVPSGL